MGHNGKKFPYKRIHAAADLASSMRKEDLGKIAELLEDGDSAVRYWGALGLLMQGKSGYEHSRDTLLTALEDKSPYVRITAAEALGKYGSKSDISKALDTLGKTVNPEDNGCFPSMLAMNAIDHLDDTGRPLLQLIQNMPNTPTDVDGRFRGYVGRLVQTTLNELGANSSSKKNSRKK